VEELRRRFSMLQTFRNYTEGECLHAGDRFVPVLAVCHNARQRRYFRKPAAIVFSLNINRERHVGNVPFGPAV